MRVKTLRNLIEELPDDAFIDVAGSSGTEEIIGVIQDLIDDDCFFILTKGHI